MRVELLGPHTASTARGTIETTLSVYYNGDLAGKVQGTSADLIDFGVGYLLSEGYLDGDSDGFSVEHDEASGTVWVYHADGLIPGGNAALDAAAIDDESATDQFPDGAVKLRTTSGGYTRQQATVPLSALGPSPCFRAEDIAAQMQAMVDQSPRRGCGQGVHCCGVGPSNSTSVLLLREDVGRHNAMDKAIGHSFLAGINLADKALFITGRISSEMAYKAYRAGVPVLVSLKSATAEAVRLADSVGMTLVARCRPESIQVLAHPERLGL